MTKPKAKKEVILMSDDQRKVWQSLADRNLKPFIDNMQSLEVAASIEVELIVPETKEVIMGKTISNALYKKLVGKK